MLLWEPTSSCLTLPPSGLSFGWFGPFPEDLAGPHPLLSTTGPDGGPSFTWPSSLCPLLGSRFKEQNSLFSPQRAG